MEKNKTADETAAPLPRMSRAENEARQKKQHIHLFLYDMARYVAESNAPNEMLLTPHAFITQEYDP